jgi:hypothetical protein
MAAGVAWGRSGGLAERYVTPSVVGLCVAWVALARYGSDRVLPIVGVLAAVLLLGQNVGPGWRFGMIQKMYHRDIEASARQGLPPTFLTARFGHLFGPPGWGVRQLTELRQVRFGAFADLGTDQPCADRPLANPCALSVPACDVASFIAHPPVVPVPPPGQRVVGLRLRYELDRDPTFVELVLSWNGGTARTTLWPRAGSGDTLFWLNADPSSITLRPLCPTFGIRVTAADWLVDR